MEDSSILALFHARDEQAIREAERKYGSGCFKIALDILHNREDAEETVNEMWMKVWQALADTVPDNLFAFLSASTRNLALDRRDRQHTRKRGSGVQPVPLEDVEHSAEARETVDSALDSRLLTEAIERFLDSLNAGQRTIFVERYTNGLTPSEIADEFGISGSRVRNTLLRVRRKLEAYLTKEGFL